MNQTETEIKLARYKETAKEADAFGRLISVRRLKPSEQIKIAGFTSELTGYAEMTNDKGATVRISHRMPLIIAASVCQIDDNHIPFPLNRGELDAIYDRLDTEGLEAAGKAFAKLTVNDRTAEVEPIDEAKNLSGTPSSV